LEADARRDVMTESRDSLEYRFRWNAGEHRRFYRALQRAARRGSKARVALHVWLGLIGAISLLGALGALRAGGPVVAVASGFIFVTVFYAFDLWWLGHATTQAYARDHAACIPNDQVRLLTPDGITARCTTSDVSVSWAGVQRVEETPEFFLFMTTPVCAIQLPKRAVGDVAHLRTWLRELTGREASIRLLLHDRP